MKQFFKFMFASCLGSALMLIITLIVLIWTVGSSTNNNVSLKPKSVLYMNLNYSIPERTTQDDITATLMNLRDLEGDYSGLNDIIANIDYAKNDPNISGIAVVGRHYNGQSGRTEKTYREFQRIREICHHLWRDYGSKRLLSRNSRR